MRSNRVKCSIFLVLSLVFLVYCSYPGLCFAQQRPQPLQAAEAGSGPVADNAAEEDTRVDNAAGGGTAVSDAHEGKISLDLKGVDIVELLKILSQKMNINIVPTKEVTGRVSVFLNDVTFEDALDVILVGNSLAAVKEKNIITVMPVDKYLSLYGKQYNEPRKVRTLQLQHASPQAVYNALMQLKTEVGKVIVDEGTGTIILVDIPESLLLMEKAVKTLDAPKDLEIYNLKYANAEELKGKLKDVVTPESSQVEFDERTNKLIVSDLPDKMKKIKKVIEALDDETKEVLIEAQIVQISLTDQTQYGIDWENLFGQAKMKQADLSGDFSISDLASMGQLSVGTLAANNFNIVIQALNQITKADIISRPRIAVVNNQEASILIGSKEVYFSQTQSQSDVTTTTAESVNYVEVGVKLNVTPTITEDDFIIMKIRPEVSTVREVAESPLGSKVPVVDTSEAETVVKVKDRAMVMIAGLMKEETRSTKKQVPILGKLPILSWIFGNRDNQRKKTELAVFLTPHIITGDVEKVDAEKEQIKATGVLTKKPKGRIE